jgi:hypothetical protein
LASGLSIFNKHGTSGKRADLIVIVFVCRDGRDAQGAPHQPQTNDSDHPVLLFVALCPDDDLRRGGVATAAVSHVHHHTRRMTSGELLKYRNWLLMAQAYYAQRRRQHFV